MTDQLPEPLVSAEVDLRDFAFMPLDVQRLRDSDLASDETPEACWAAVLLWCASWHQVPAASLPDDDKALAQYAGYGRVVNISSGAGQLTALGDGMPAYRLSKASLNALTCMLAAALSESNVLVNSMDPGAVKTRLGGISAKRSVAEGADTAVWLATLPDQPHRRDVLRLRHIVNRVSALFTGWRSRRGGFFRDRIPIPW